MKHFQTCYIIDRRIFVSERREDTRKAAERLLSAWQAAEQAVEHHVELQPELGLASGYLVCNPDLTLIDEQISSVDNLVMSRLFDDERRAVIYSVTCRVPNHHRPISEPRFDMLQKGRTWKMAHSISMTLSEFVQEHSDQNDPDRPLLHRIPTDLGQCRLVHSSNLQKTFDNLAKGSPTATEAMILDQLETAIKDREATPGRAAPGSGR